MMGFPERTGAVAGTRDRTGLSFPFHEYRKLIKSANPEKEIAPESCFWNAEPSARPDFLRGSSEAGIVCLYRRIL
jgi:hypothetical protein